MLTSIKYQLESHTVLTTSTVKDTSTILASFPNAVRSHTNTYTNIRTHKVTANLPGAGLVTLRKTMERGRRTQNSTMILTLLSEKNESWTFASPINNSYRCYGWVAFLIDSLAKCILCAKPSLHNCF